MIDKADAVVLQAVAEFRFQQHSSLYTRRTDQASHRGELRWLGRGPALSGVFSDVSEEEGTRGLRKRGTVSSHLSMPYQGPFRTWCRRGFAPPLVRWYIAPWNACGKFQPVVAGYPADTQQN